jgi:hypothetical protein
MNTVTFMVLAAIAVGLWPVIRDFDRKMVAAGQRRRAEAEEKAQASARATPAVSATALISAACASDGSLQYAIQFDGEETVYRLVPEPSAQLHHRASSALLTVRAAASQHTLPDMRRAAGSQA